MSLLFPANWDTICHYPLQVSSGFSSATTIIGLYREIAIAIQKESDDSNLMGVMCSTSQCEFRSTFPNLRVTNVIRIVRFYTLQGSKLGKNARSQLAPRYFFLGANIDN